MEKDDDAYDNAHNNIFIQASKMLEHKDYKWKPPTPVSRFGRPQRSEFGFVEQINQ